MGIDNDIFGMTLCTSIRIHDNGATFRCQQSINGRYVTVVNRDGPVSICDFKIHGKLKKGVIMNCGHCGPSLTKWLWSVGQCNLKCIILYHPGWTKEDWQRSISNSFKNTVKPVLSGHSKIDKTKF